MNLPFANHWLKSRITASDEQRQVLDSGAAAIIISALAGTGKTTTLCMKASNLISRLGGQAHILVLAYSRAGVIAIRDRMVRLNGVMPEGLEVLTIEQLCASLLEKQGDPLERLEDPVRRRQMILQAQQALLQDLEHEHDLELGEWLARDVDIDAFLALEALVKKRLLDRQQQDSGMSLRDFCADMDLHYGCYRLYQKYERMRVGINGEPGFYAEGDCTFEVCRQLDLLDWDQPYEWLQECYDAVLFDELHDLDEGALMVLRKLVHGNNGFFVGAGDFNQHIHEGAFSVFGESLQRIKAYLPEDIEVLHINTTRRFGAEICNALNPLFDVAFQPLEDASDAFVPLSYDTDLHCVQQLVELHAQVANGWSSRQGRQGGDSALNVILRDPKDSLLIEWMFGHEGVHYGCQGISPFYLRREVALTLALMWAIHGSVGEKMLTPGILSAAVEGLAHYGRRSLGSKAANPDRLAQSQFDESGWSELPGIREGHAMAASLYGDIERTRRYITYGTLDPRAANQTDACAAILGGSGPWPDDAGGFCEHPLLRRIFVEAPINEKERKACLASLKALADLARGIPVGEFLGRLSLIVTKSIEMHRSKEPVTLRILSIEASKGREFMFVAVPFVERGRFPGPSRHEEAYRERNMLYVAMTRARAALWLLEGRAKPVRPGPV
jgi:superfamily I DNA/RNA helicase